MGFEDLLEFQYSLRRELVVLCVGAFDGLSNDPTGAFLRAHTCTGHLLEPQPNAFARLAENYRDLPRLTPLNLAIDRTTGVRTLYYVPAGTPGLPSWTEQLASFRIEHLRAHESDAPGVSLHIRPVEIPTISFEELLATRKINYLDLLQIDAEGSDGELLAWFPFDRLKPKLIHYETAHLPAKVHQSTRLHLESNGYRVRNGDAPTDDVAILQ